MIKQTVNSNCFIVLFEKYVEAASTYLLDLNKQSAVNSESLSHATLFTQSHSPFHLCNVPNQFGFQLCHLKRCPTVNSAFFSTTSFMISYLSFTFRQTSLPKRLRSKKTCHACGKQGHISHACKEKNKETIKLNPNYKAIGNHFAQQYYDRLDNNDTRLSVANFYSVSHHSKLFA